MASLPFVKIRKKGVGSAPVEKEKPKGVTTVVEESTAEIRNEKQS